MTTTVKYLLVNLKNTVDMDEEEVEAKKRNERTRECYQHIFLAFAHQPYIILVNKRQTKLLPCSLYSFSVLSQFRYTLDENVVKNS